MPQLDISTYSSQIFWLVVCFATLYFFASNIILPRIRDIQDTRKNAIDSDLSSAKTLEDSIEALNTKTNTLRQNATAAYQEKLDEATQKAAVEKEALMEDVKHKIEKITQKSHKDLEEFIASTKSQSQLAVEDLVKNIKTKLFNIS